MSQIAHWVSGLPKAVQYGLSDAAAAVASIDLTFSNDWRSWVLMIVMIFFAFGLLHSVRTHLRARKTLRREIEAPKPTLSEVQALADAHRRPLPFIVVLVPARDESAVIRKTIERITQLDYPSDRYAAIVITDAREQAVDHRATTQTISTRMARTINQRVSPPLLHVIEVPEWYSGRFGDKDKTYARSTKPRALNWALGYVRDHPDLSEADLIGILDADGRLHPAVLREVAYRSLMDGEKLMQGPVFQISNFSDVGLVGKAAAIELSVHHLSTLSRQLLSKRQTPRFLAGTNYFVDLALLMEAGGWNESALTEDAELGVRLFVCAGARPAWLSCHEVEQTPPDWRTYLRQRERWSLGHFQLLAMVRHLPLPWRVRVLLRARVVTAAFRSIFDIGLPVLGWVALALGWATLLDPRLGWVMVGLLVGSVFVWDFFGRGARMLNRYRPEPEGRGRLWLLRLRLIAAMPLLMVLQAQPRISALWRHLAGSQDVAWEKTRRTVEEDPDRECRTARPSTPEMDEVHA